MRYSNLMILAAFILFTGCQAENQENNELSIDPGNQNENHKNDTNETDQNDTDQIENDQNNHTVEEEESGESMSLPLHDYNGEEDFLALSDLAEALDGELNVDQIHRTAELQVENRFYYLVEEVPVLQINGIHHPKEHFEFQFFEEEAYVSVGFIESALDHEYEITDESVDIQWDIEITESWEDPREVFHHDDMSVKDIIEYLSFLQSPIEDASVSTVDSHLPGAPRDYRNGYHEGIDWYDYTTEVVINTDTPILAQADGTVVRADIDFEDYASHDVRNEDLAKAAEVGFTPEYILDRLRGQQVWVQYDHGVMIRFAHLDSIPEEIEAGMSVDKDTVIGYVGNSGTSGALDGDNSGLHLHQDLLIYDRLFYEPYTLEETRKIIHELWGDGI
ncbi:M23 family metallopeptidase [Salisediminibacterium beveridgei]|uniref:Peptidase M n=1 Tax=Salisediminibacterium beveridgei TaxID=632773 RepID=A0A1D7QWG8_9BACI|nr:M23 family metallopeptidase [Salisediminibacterium beveridgei]AOM83319.1 Peptidase M [Salisediminibacterium beveridgei]